MEIVLIKCEMRRTDLLGPSPDRLGLYTKSPVVSIFQGGRSWAIYESRKGPSGASRLEELSKSNRLAKWPRHRSGY